MVVDRGFGGVSLFFFPLILLKFGWFLFCCKISCLGVISNLTPQLQYFIELVSLFKSSKIK